MIVEEESQEWARLIDELAIYLGNLSKIPSESNTDYLLKFKIGEGNFMSLANGARKFCLEDPRSKGELEN